MAEIHYVQEIKGLDMGTWPDHNHDLMTNAFECTSANQHLHSQGNDKDPFHIDW